MKTQPNPFLFYLSLLIFSLNFSIATLANAESLAPPQLGIQEASEKLRLRMKDKSFIQNFDKVNEFVQTAINPHVDFNRISALVLGQNWKQASADERARFTKEFQILLIRTYSRAFVEFKDWSIRFMPLSMEPGATKVVVNTEVLQPGLQPISVSYRMILTEGHWRAYDIMIEGVSLVTNYRSTFDNEIAKSGSLQSVISDLAKRNADALASKA
jgi:phospholipid transport system substrate-binding protein